MTRTSAVSLIVAALRLQLIELSLQLRHHTLKILHARQLVPDRRGQLATDLIGGDTDGLSDVLEGISTIGPSWLSQSRSPMEGSSRSLRSSPSTAER